MDIKIVTAHYLPTTNAASIRLSSFVKSWKNDSNVNIDILTSRNNKSKLYSGAKETFIPLVNNDSRFIVRLLFEILFSIEIFLRLLFSDDEIYFVSSPPFLLTLSVFLVSKIKNKKYILDVRDLYPEVLFNLNIINQKSLLGRGLLFLEKTVYDNAFLISTVTNGLVDHIKNKSANQNIYLIRNGYSKNLFYPQKIKSDDKFKIIFHGTMGKFQNIELIVELAKLFKDKNMNDIELTIIGDGDKSSCLERKIEEFNLKNINYLGRKNIKEIPKFINESDIGISPRIDGMISQTSFPVKVYEYLGCGKPVLVTPISEVGNFIEENEMGFQVKNDVDELFKLILKFKNDNKLYEELVQNVKDKANKFERNKIAKEYLNIIKSQIQKNNGNRVDK